VGLGPARGCSRGVTEQKGGKVKTIAFLMTTLFILNGCASTYEELHQQEMDRYYSQKDAWVPFCEIADPIKCGPVPTTTKAPKEGEYNK
jgi:hypothetical protein